MPESYGLCTTFDADMTRFASRRNLDGRRFTPSQIAKHRSDKVFETDRNWNYEPEYKPPRQVERLVRK